MSKYFAICLFIAVGCARAASAQEYIEDENTDGTYIYVDLTADPAASSSPCPSEVYITSTFNGASASGTAFYPNTYTISQESANAQNGAEYTWTREIQHYGQQRGGNCGVFSDVSLNWPLSIVYTTGKTSNVGSGSGSCYQTASCTSTQVPLCPNSTTTPKTWVVLDEYCESGYISFYLAYRTSNTNPRNCISNSKNGAPGYSQETSILPGFCIYKGS